MQAKVGELRVSYSVRGIPRYEVDVVHEQLHKHRTLRDQDRHVLWGRAQMQAAEWNQIWQEKSSAASARFEASRLRQDRKYYLETQKQEAASLSSQAQAAHESLRGILAATIEKHDAIRWEELKDHAEFPELRPQRPPTPPPPTVQAHDAAPDKTSYKYQPKLHLLDHLIPSRKRQRLQEAEACYAADYDRWKSECDQIDAKNARSKEKAEAAVVQMQANFQAEVDAWAGRRAEFQRKKAEQHAAIEEFRTRYEGKDPDALASYFDLVLMRSEYPDFIEKDFELGLRLETGLLIVDYRLPAPSLIPTLVEVKYIQSSDSFSEKHLTEGQAQRLYDDFVYQFTLRTVHELFESDSGGVLKLVVFNGIVTAVDKATGNEVTACIVSLQAERESFLQINLANVDPKACFRQLKGVGSSQLHSITAVAPIVALDRADRRFVEAYGVTERLHEGYNLAAMDWQDFEHLIREIFAKEFTSDGAEVRVTQASRDGGVDAVAFDPDPIRGGKIVIQAKRYANTVGVAAVRDLYGTVLNEGATKGILVTTSDYGPDAYQFANGKPLTLLSGSNLLHLLQKHGVKAHVDLADAKRQFKGMA